MENDLLWIARGLRAAAEQFEKMQPVTGCTDGVLVTVKINKDGPVTAKLEAIIVAGHVQKYGD